MKSGFFPFIFLICWQFLSKMLYVCTVGIINSIHYCWWQRTQKIWSEHRLTDLLHLVHRHLKHHSCWCCYFHHFGSCHTAQPITEKTRLMVWLNSASQSSLLYVQQTSSIWFNFDMQTLMCSVTSEWGMGLMSHSGNTVCFHTYSKSTLIHNHLSWAHVSCFLYSIHIFHSYTY